LPLSLLFLVGFWILLRSSRPPQKEVPNNPINLLHDELNGLLPPQVIPFVVSQAAFETGDFISPVFKRNRNFFGMRFPKVRETTAIKDLNGYAFYDSYNDSVKDFVLWYNYVGMPTTYTLSDYIRELDQRQYFEADYKKYLAGTKSKLEKYYG